jgi:hypothetical protein
MGVEVAWRCNDRLKRSLRGDYDRNATNPAKAVKPPPRW